MKTLKPSTMCRTIEKAYISSTIIEVETSLGISRSVSVANKIADVCNQVLSKEHRNHFTKVKGREFLTIVQAIAFGLDEQTPEFKQAMLNTTLANTLREKISKFLSDYVSFADSGVFKDKDAKDLYMQVVELIQSGHEVVKDLAKYGTVI